MVLALCSCSVACDRSDESEGRREGLVATNLSHSRNSETVESEPTRPSAPNNPSLPPGSGGAPYRPGQPSTSPPSQGGSPGVSPDAGTGALSQQPGVVTSQGTPPRRGSDPSFPDTIAEAGAELLQRTQASRWSLEGSLGPDDLTMRLRTDVTNTQGDVLGEAGFNLGVLHGFQGVPKCNLLAFEIAFRAGFVVPLVGRSVGWGFPSSEMIANDARDNHIIGEWAAVRQRPVATEINLDRDLGTAFMAVARAAIYGRFGHVAIIDWVETLSLTREGDIRVLSFMGWEANTTEGARYTRITFATTDAVPSSRFDYIYILELRAAEPGNEVALIGRGPRNPTGIVNLEGMPDEEGRPDRAPGQ